MSHSVRLDDGVYDFLKLKQQIINAQQKRGGRGIKKHFYSLSEVIEWYIDATNGWSAAP
jgi:hypothetical protein